MVGKNKFLVLVLIVLSLFVSACGDSNQTQPKISKIATDLQKEAKISIKHEIDGEQHLFVVSDNGSGIDDEGLKLIFSAGFSTKINYNTGEINRGLGLSIVQYIVEEQLAGKVNVSSKLNVGTSFYIYIPRKSLEGVRNENIYS